MGGPGGGGGGGAPPPSVHHQGYQGYQGEHGRGRGRRNTAGSQSFDVSAQRRSHTSHGSVLDPDFFDSPPLSGFRDPLNAANGAADSSRSAASSPGGGDPLNGGTSPEQVVDSDSDQDQDSAFAPLHVRAGSTGGGGGVGGAGGLASTGASTGASAGCEDDAEPSRHGNDPRHVLRSKTNQRRASWLSKGPRVRVEASMM